MYRLKKNQPAFQVTDGAFAGRTFVHGKDYQEIPKEEAHRFDDDAPARKKPAKAVQAQEVSEL